MRRPVLTVLAFSLLGWALAGCLRQDDGLTSEEIERVAWYVEDVAHGLPRDPYELAAAEASPGMQNLAIWALGRVEDQRSVEPPRLLAIRRARWPLLQQGLREGVLAVDAAGLLRLVPDIDASDRAAFAEVAHQENLDRLAVVSILLGRGGLSPESRRGRLLAATMRAARIHHDTGAGGPTWASLERAESDESSTSTSERADTPSTSPPAPFDRRSGF